MNKESIKQIDDSTLDRYLNQFLKRSNATFCDQKRNSFDCIEAIIKKFFKTKDLEKLNEFLERKPISYNFNAPNRKKAEAILEILLTKS